MRLGRVLAFAVLEALSSGCRRPPPPAPTPPPDVATAAPAPAPPSAVTPAPPSAPAAAPAATPTPAPAAAEPPAGELGVARVPAPDPPASPARAAAKDDDDGALYSWEDAEGVIHFGTADEAPPGRRHLRKLEGKGVSVLPAEPVGTLPRTSSVPSAPESADNTKAKPAAEEAPALKKGPTPQLDADGLPIPGTMDDNAHTRAVRAATGGVTVDPASAEREHQKQLRELKCRVVDGATICG